MSGEELFLKEMRALSQEVAVLAARFEDFKNWHRGAWDEQKEKNEEQATTLRALENRSFESRGNLKIILGIVSFATSIITAVLTAIIVRAVR